MKSRKFIRRVCAVLAGVALVPAFYGVENWRGERAWAAEQARLRARGEPLSWTGWVARPPAVSNVAEAPPFKGLLDYHVVPGAGPMPRHTWAGQPVVDRWNAMLHVEPASEPGRTSRGQQPFPVLDLAGLAEQYRRSTNHSGVPRTAEPARDILAALETRRAFLAEIEEATRLPSAAFAIRYEDHARALLPQLALIKSAAQTFRNRAVARLATGDRQGALADVGTIHRLARVAGSDPTLIGLLVQVAVEMVAVNVAWQGWQAGGWTAAEHAGLRAMFADVDLRRVAARAFRGERLFGSSLIEFLASHRGQFVEVFGDTIPGEESMPGIGRAVSWMPGGWFRQNQARHSRHLDAIVQAIESAPAGLALMAEGSRRLPMEYPARPGAYDVLVRWLVPALGNAAARIDHGEAHVLLVRVACAVERHRTATGRLPARLGDMVGGELAEVPVDPMDGEPLRYHPSPDGTFILYSVGPDGRDDGGEAQDSGGATPRDWVWRGAARATGL